MAEILNAYQVTDQIKLRNRLVMAPMTTWSSQADGQVSIEELDYYRYRSQGVGLVITGTTYTLPSGVGFENQFYGGDDLYIPSLRKLADAIHMGGAKAVLQIFHAGRMSKSNLQGGTRVVSASDIPAVRPDAQVPRPLLEGEIHNIIESFYETTKRAIKAGFDGVEIHGANTYLLQQFFSPHSNRREDYWGGSLEKRLRFPMAIVHRVLAAVAEEGPNDFMVGYRFSPEEIEEPGISLEDTLFLVDALADTDLTYLNVSLERYNQTSKRQVNLHDPIGKLLLQKIRGRKPLMGSGGISTLEDANDALGLGYDMIQLGKTLIMNPDWVGAIRNHRPLREGLTAEDVKRLYIPSGLYKKMLEHEGWFNLLDAPK